MKLNYGDYTLNKIAKSLRFNVSKKKIRKSRQGEMYEGSIPIASALNLDDAIQRIVYDILEDNKDITEFKDFLLNLELESKKISNYLDNLVNNIYNHKKLTSYLFKSEDEAIIWKASLGKNIIKACTISYEGNVNDIPENYQEVNKIFLQKEDVTKVNYVLILKLK